mmetsp:Transcript_46029/g.109571  ORF Transcript_46029/g.109571 Transcript_46029/m.109571 type:complete len:900 (+) Transcript_46029:68-2767(+)
MRGVPCRAVLVSHESDGPHDDRSSSCRHKRTMALGLIGFGVAVVLKLVASNVHTVFVSSSLLATKPAARDAVGLRASPHNDGIETRHREIGASELDFEPREVGSSEQYMLSQLSDGRLVTIHCFAAIVDGEVVPDRLRAAIRWAVLRHPMLRATVLSDDDEEVVVPFLRVGQKGDGRKWWRPSNMSTEAFVDRVLVLDDDAPAKNLDEVVRSKFELELNSVKFDLETGPLWRLKLIRGSAQQSALLFSFIHSLDDQISGNLLLDQLLAHMEASEAKKPWDDPESLSVPQGLEDALLTKEVDPILFAKYALSQAMSQAEDNVIFPSSMRKKERDPKKNFVLDPSNPTSSDRPTVLQTVETQGEAKALVPNRIDPETEFASLKRRSLVVFRTLSAETQERLRQECRENGVTVTMALAAAALLAASDVSHDELDYGYESYRLLLGLDMRRFADEGDWTKGTVAFASGAMDFAARLLPKSGEALEKEIRGTMTRSKIGGVPFWDLARATKDAYSKWVDAGYVPESARLFDAGMRVARLEQIVTTNADNPLSLGRAYTATLSNVGVYRGATDGKYGSLSLKHLYFGISQAITGSMLAASCVTVNGEMHMTAIAPEPIVSAGMLEAFSDSIIRTLTAVAEQPQRAKWTGEPRTDYPTDVRGGLPWYYVLETPKGTLQCPEYEEIKSPTMPPFEVDKYLGIWYELAFHDITQANGCGCTQFNMTRRGLMIEDMFTVSCPWPWKEGIDGPWLPGYSEVSGKRRLNLYTCNMTMYIDPARPGVMKETGFAQEFNNMVLEVWKDPEITAQTGYEYTRSIQFQCVTSPLDGSISFTGINFLSRVPHVSPQMMQEFYVRARALGLEPYGVNDMHVVNHEGCVYPKSTDRSWMGERPEWPFPVFTNELGALL